MGDLVFRSREYVVVVIETDEGITGHGFGMTRNAPVAAIVERNLAPLLLGRDPLMTEALWESMYFANLPIAGGGVFMRGLSAVDIALWDIKGKAAAQPVWRLLGGARTRSAVSIAGGYPLDGATHEDLAAEMADYASRGFAIVKIAAGPLAGDTARLRVARDALDGRALLAYDAHWAWRRLTDVVPIVREWASFGLTFLEDPFPPELIALAGELRAATGIPVALGEDAVGRWAFRRLLDEVAPDVLRLDATTMGGLSEAARVCGLASIHARPVIPHVFPEIHVHLAAAFPIVHAVELTLPEYEIEGLYRLFDPWVTIDHGEIVAPELPGLGITLDNGAVDRYTVGSVRVAA